MAIEKLWSSFTEIANISTYIGNVGQLFYERGGTCLRISDGVTPGGQPFGSCASFGPTEITTSSTVTVVTVDTTTTKSTKFAVSVEKGSSNRYFEVTASHNSTTPFHSVSDIIGDIIDLSVDVDIVGTDMRLRITNNEASAISISGMRFAIK